MSSFAHYFVCVCVCVCVCVFVVRISALFLCMSLKTEWQEYTEEVYKEDLHDPDNHDGVITHLEPDILECEVRWALGSITMNKLVEVMEFQLTYFKS